MVGSRTFGCCCITTNSFKLSSDSSLFLGCDKEAMLEKLEAEKGAAEKAGTLF
jgi:hypothetical protein